MLFQIAKLIGPQNVPNSQSTLYTSPGSTTTRIDKLSVTNTDSSVHTITINVVGNGGSVAAANETTSAQAIQPGQTWNSPNEVGLVLAPGDFISVIGSASGVMSIAAGGLIGS